MKRYTNREKSWLQFNRRVLMEASDSKLPLIERFKFLSIFCSNLDEFFMVRVGSLHDQLNAGYDKLDLAGFTVSQQLHEIDLAVRELLELQQKVYHHLMQEAEREHFHVESWETLEAQERDKLRSYFEAMILPVLTPLAIDSHRPFPLLVNKSIYLAVEIKAKKKNLLSLIQVPSILPRLIEIERSKKRVRYIFLEELILNNLTALYTNHEILSVSQFRITRNGDLTVDEEDAEDLLMVIEDSLKQRKWGEVMRMELRSGYHTQIMERLKKLLSVTDEKVFFTDQPLDHSAFMGLEGPLGSKAFRPLSHQPRRIPFLEKKDLFAVVSKEDQFFHVPYDSFRYIENIIQQAASDEQVLAIKMTLYRVNEDSLILKSLKHAALAGKQVTVLVELLARFDEEKNIEWARQLEKSGANVIYGIPGLKTHSKIFLIVRREKDGIRRYVHLGTGNYNSNTAKLYTDMSVLTAREDIGSDASTFFNLISAYADNPNLKRLVPAPDRLRKRIEELIDGEIAAVSQGKKAYIDIKINSLVDKKMIDKLYEASQAGVKIRLLVRGICSLIPGKKKLSENIQVRSVVGEFLEHERIYYFSHGSPENLFLASADLMTRNLDRRIELLFPVLNEEIQARVRSTFELLWQDNVKSWEQDHNANYHKRHVEGNVLHAHQILKEMVYRNNRDFYQQMSEILHED